jgi:hypothetical protein
MGTWASTLEARPGFFFVRSKERVFTPSSSSLSPAAAPASAPPNKPLRRNTLCSCFRAPASIFPATGAGLALTGDLSRLGSNWFLSLVRNPNLVRCISPREDFVLGGVMNSAASNQILCFCFSIRGGPLI